MTTTASPLPLPAILGPTACGKTALALALAERFPVEVISVDSALVYRGMTIGTAKPDASERARCPHHLIDLVEPETTYTVGRFVADAERVAAEIAARGRIPLLVGGTMLYAKALHEGLAALPAADATLRAEIDTRAAREGWPKLHAWLAEHDPETAARLSPNDRQRIQRALEVVLTTGKPMAAVLAEHQAQAPRDRLTLLALIPGSRTWLHDRIAARFHQMLAAGFVAEVAALRQRPALTAEHPSMRAVGYRQVWAYLDGQLSETEMIAAGIAATRQLAKRQLTWLRQFTNRWPRVTVLDPCDPQLIAKASAWLCRTAIAATTKA